jgi:DNA-binding NtrC family response regulator
MRDGLRPTILLVGGELDDRVVSSVASHGFDLLRSSQRADLAILSADDGDSRDWREAAERLRRDDPHVPLILLVARGSEAAAVAALRAGVNDYLSPPWLAQDLIASISRLLKSRELRATSSQPRARPLPTLVGESRSMRDIREVVARVARTDANVVVTGETGTGKELVAELIHLQSPRRSGPFVAINCAAIPEGLLESELFGYERGAFTGAHTSHPGHLAAARGGTVFLDEVGDLSAAAQAKLLRVLDAREVYRLGSTTRVSIDVRIVAATNRDLLELVNAGQFRKDLYYRLRVAHIHVPPLRERREDVPALVAFYAQRFGRQLGAQVDCSPPLIQQALMDYDWPGNVRELRNFVEGLFAELPLHPTTRIEFPERLLTRLRPADPLVSPERDRLLAALGATRWNKSRAAQELRWSRMTLYRKMARYGVVCPARSADTV